MAQTRSQVLDTHYSSTLKHVDKEVVDQFFEKYTTIDEFRRSFLQTVTGGGSAIEVKLQTSGNNQAASFSGMDVLTKQRINPIESAEYNRRYYFCPMILADTDSWENSGAEKVFDEMENLRDIAMDALLKVLNEDVYSAQAGKNILGFQDLIADAAGATIGGVDSSVTTVWDNQRSTTATTFLTQTVTNVFNGIDLWNDLLDLIMIQKGSSKGKIFTTWSINKAYRVALSSQGYARTDVNDAKGVGGNLSPPFYGYQPFPDNDCTALHSYFVSGSSKRDAGINMHVMSNVNFKKTPFVSLQSNAQLAELAYLVVGVQFTTKRRRQNAVATALTGT